MSFIAELKRRNVFKVAAAYVVVSWLVLQIVDTLGDMLQAPDSLGKVVVILLVAGFPVALFLAWAYELTPEGIKKEHEVDKTESITHVTGKKINTVIMVLLIVALSYFIWKDQAVQTAEMNEPTTVEVAGQASEEAAETETGASEIPEASIAVLPFVNMSDDASQEYFSDGVTEEILNVLAKNPKLKVAARTSSFYFKGKNMPIKELAQKLEVAHVLEGSIRKAGDDIRITAQLIRASDGYHLWSDAYNRKLANIFEVQEEIARLISEALQAPMGLKAGDTKEISADVYDMYLQARAYIRRRDEGVAQAIALLEEIVQQAPGFADAWAALSNAYGIYPKYSNQTDKLPEYIEKSTRAARTAYQVNPESAMSNWVMANVFSFTGDGDYTKAFEHYRTAIKLDPQLHEVYEDWNEAYRFLGFLEKALEIAQEGVRKNPYSALLRGAVSSTLFQLGRYDEAEQMAQKMLELQPGFFWAYEDLVNVYARRGQYEKAIATINNCLHCLKTGRYGADKEFLLAKLENPDLEIPYEGQVYHSAAVLYLAGGVQARLQELQRFYNYGVLGLIRVSYYEKDLFAHPDFYRFVKASILPGQWRKIGWPKFCQPVGEDDFTCGWPE